MTYAMFIESSLRLTCTNQQSRLLRKATFSGGILRFLQRDELRMRSVDFVWHIQRSIARSFRKSLCPEF